MDVLEYNEEHKATLMMDVIEALVGEDVCVFSNYAVTGKLVSYNGHLLHVFSSTDDKHYYLRSDFVRAISAKK